MIFRNSLLNLRRAWKKTTVFLALLLALTTLLSLSVSVWVSVSGFLNGAREEYRTVGVFEYLDPAEPGDATHSAEAQRALRELDALNIAAVPGALGWDATERAIGVIDGYSREDCTELHIFLQVPENTVLEYDRFYAVCGEFYSGITSYKYFLANGMENAAAARSGCETPAPCTDVTTPEGSWSLPADSAYYDAAETIRAVNNSVNVWATSDAASLPAFQQQRRSVVAGRELTAEEYAREERVCLLSQSVAEMLGLAPGDTVELSLAATEGADADESYWAGVGFASQNEYTVVGLVSDVIGEAPAVYLPKSADAPLTNLVGATLGVARVENDAAAEFYAALENVLPERVSLTLYDQGYAGVAESFGYIRRIAALTTAACALVCLAVLGMFGYLYVYRQREVSQIMIRLGTGKRRVYGYFAAGSGVLGGAASLVGAAAGWLLSGVVGQAVARFAEEHTLVDARYSRSALTVTRGTDFSVDVAPGLFLAVAGAVTLLAVGFCMAFTARTLARRGGRRAGSGRGGARSVSLRGGAAKYALLSVFRGGTRTAIAPALALAATILFTSLASSSASYEARLGEIYASTPVTGALTDGAGRVRGTAAMTGDLLNALIATGQVEDVAVTRSVYQYYLGPVEKDGKAMAAPEFTDVLPQSGFAMETFLDNVERGGKFIFTNDLDDSPEFLFSGGAETRWLEGVEREDFNSGEQIGYVVSTDFLAENNLALGDSIRVYYYADRSMDGRDNVTGTVDAPIVGSYVKQGKLSNLYFPMGALRNLTALPLSPEDEGYEALRYQIYNSVGFALKEPAQIWNFKQQLADASFAQAGTQRGARTYLVLEDRTLLTLVGNLKQQMRFAELLYPLLYALALGCGLLSSFLITRSRQRELAVMRAVGAKKGRAFAALFLELALLTLLGAGLGLALGWRSPRLGFVLTGAYVLLSLAGGALALLRMNRGAAMAMLHEEE